MHNSGTATRSFRFIYHPRRCDFGVFQMFSSTRYYQYFSLNMCNRPERKAGPCGEKGLTPLFWPGTAGALELPKRLPGALERNNRYNPPVSLALRELLSRVSRNLGFFRASKHGVSGYSVPLPGGSRVIVEIREERTDPLHYPLFKSFLRGSFEGSINALKLTLVESESLCGSQNARCSTSPKTATVVRSILKVKDSLDGTVR